MEQRRSIRRYKDKPVSRDILDRIIEAAHRAPTGTSRRSVTSMPASPSAIRNTTISGSSLGDWPRSAI
ncbi:MAG: nitroreductase family protein [Deltaproteobacteria bacterium]|nr:nitroreductase family protein [Deltaproteobacteria bacterium]MBW2076125.1 nitroreductase family protein [Deltaproteobacteria bacterium]